MLPPLQPSVFHLQYLLGNETRPQARGWDIAQTAPQQCAGLRQAATCWHSITWSSDPVVVINYGLVLWLPSPHEIENMPSWFTSKSIKQRKIHHDKSNVGRKNYNNKSKIYICHRFPHPFSTWRLKSNVHKNVHKTSIWQWKWNCS